MKEWLARQFFRRVLEHVIGGIASSVIVSVLVSWWRGEKNVLARTTDAIRGSRVLKAIIGLLAASLAYELLVGSVIELLEMFWSMLLFVIFGIAAIALMIPLPLACAGLAGLLIVTVFCYRKHRLKRREIV
jgi:hypothetical protein